MAHDSAIRRGVHSGIAAFAVATLVAGCGSPAPITACEPGEGLSPVCGFDNPEDLASSHGNPWLLVSEMARGGGRITAFRPSDGSRRTLYHAGEDFHPHGIDLSRDGRTLFVVDHGGTESVEIFDVRAGADAAPTLHHQRSVRVPDELDARLNDVAATPSGFVATKMMPSNQTWGMLRMLFGADTGELLRWTRTEDEWSVVPNSRGLGPNGLAASDDGSRIYFSEWGRARIVAVNVDGTLRIRSDELGFSPDNISWTRDGKLLVAGQNATLLETLACLDMEAGATCGISSSVVSVDPESLASVMLLHHDPASVVGAASVALEHGRAIWIGSFSGDRIVRFSGLDR